MDNPSGGPAGGRLKAEIIKSASIISLGTVSSRILGFFRDILLARWLGTAMAADSFFVAFRIPNLLRDILGEGATNSAVVPVFAEYVAKKDRREVSEFFSVVLILLAIFLGLMTLLGIVFAPVMVRMIAPGFMADPKKLQMTVHLTQIMFPYLFFIGLTAYSMGILYTLRSFFVPAFSPCLLNLAIIASILIAFRTMKEPVFGLAAGVLAGGILQLLAQAGPMAKEGMRFVRPSTLSHPGAKKIGKLLLPRLVGTSVYQLNIFIDTFCASLSSVVGQGGISAIYYANRVIQFPLGVFSVALASAILPSLSGFAAKENSHDLRKTLLFSLENTFLVMVPASVFLMVLSVPIIRVLFERGEFNSYSTAITSSALLFYTIGLASFGGVRILVTAFHAQQDTLTPVRVAFGCLLINTVLNFVLMGPLKIGGIALASAIASLVNFLLLFHFIDKKLGQMKTQIASCFLRILLASVVMGWVVFLGWKNLTAFPELTRLILMGVAGFFVFMGLGLLFKIGQVEGIARWISKKR